MANFSWLISQLDSIPSIDGMDKVISVIHYRAQKTHEGFTADTYGAISMQAPHEASFTPYDEVTKEMVESWLTESLDCEAIEANLNSQIENFLNPPVVAYALPWNLVSTPASEPAVEEIPVVEEPFAEPAAEETVAETPASEPAVEEPPVAGETITE